MNPPTDPKQRLTDAIAAAYAPYGGSVTGETLLLPDGEQPLQALFRYLELVALSREFTYLPPLFGPGEGLPMAGMYVELAVSHSRAAPMPGLLGASLSLAAAQEQRRLRQLAQRLNADDALGCGRQHNMVVLGDPGGGKTSLLKRATARIASGLWPAWIVPLYIPLRRYWESRRRFPDAGLTLLRHAAMRIVEVGQQPFLSEYGTASTLHPKLAAPEILAEVDAMESLLSQISGVKKQHVLFLLDGLDEIASDPEAVQVLGDEIRHLAYGFSWVVASRRAGFFGGLEEDVRYEVLSLDNDGIEQLVRNWFRHQEHAPASAGDRVLAQVAGNPRLLAMARNPFLLTLLCHLQAAEIGDLPLYRSAVYERIFKLAREQLQHREKDKTRFGLTELEFLSGFCRHLYTDAPRAPRHLFDRDDWAAFAGKTPAPDLERHFLASRLLDRWGEGDDYHLAHLTLHEYLVARDLADAPVGTAIGRTYSPHWRMVLRFIAGLYRERGREEELGGLVRSLLEPVDLNGLLYIEAAQLLLEADLEDSTHLLGYDLRKNLWQLWRQQTDYVAEAAGRALATLAPALALARIRALLDAQQGRINLMAAPSDPGRLALAGVDLLADIPLDAAGDLLVSLLCDDTRPNLADAAVHALVRRNWPTVRRAVLERAATVSSETFKRICHIASFSRHADFAPWLLASLQASAEPTHELVEASALVGGPELDAALLERLRSTPWRLADFPPTTWEGVLSTSSEWQIWVVANAADDLTHRALAVHHRLIDEAKTLEWLATAQGDDLEELIVAIGDGASVPHAVEDALLACLSGSAAVRSRVVYALLRIDNERHGRDAAPRHRELFAQLLDDPESEVRELALTALGNLGDARRLDRMLELAGDPRQPLIVRCAGIEALGKLPSDPEITDHLEDWLADPFEQIGQEAALALARTEPGRLAAHLASDRVRAALAQVGAEQGLLFFESFYVDAGGKRHPWRAESLPAINPDRHGGPYFVSYNSRDIEMVRGLILQLEAAGISLLWDRADMPRQGRWQQELYAMIQSAIGAIILCGPHGPGDWQQEEIDACLSRTKEPTGFSLRSVWLPGMEPKAFVGFLDNYDRLDLREGLEVETDTFR